MSVRNHRRSLLLVVGLMVVIAGLPVVASPGLADTEPVGITAEAAREAWSLFHPGAKFDAQVQYQQHFRSQFDFLDASDETIYSVMAAADDNGSYERWGLHLTNVEAAELDRRDRIQREMPALAAAAVGDDWSEELVEGLDPDGSFGAFSGRWIDQLDGGKLKIGMVKTHPDHNAAVTRLSAALESRLLSGVLAASDVEIVYHDFTLDEIYTANRAFAERYLQPSMLENPIPMSVSIDPVGNRAALFVEASHVELARSFARQFPDGLVELIVVGDGDLTGHDSVEPRDYFGAGFHSSGAAIKIRDGNNGWVGSCSWGATARTSSYVYVVTAAHCLGYGITYGADGDWNHNRGAAARRGVKDHGNNDWITDPNKSSYVYAYHGVRGDIARLMINEASNVHDHDCMLEDGVICGERMTRRELTTETEIGDLKCSSLANSGDYRCATISTNDAPWPGYDYLRGVNTGITTHVENGDSGGGWKESSLLTGITKGWLVGGGKYDSYLTHAYYIEASTYLAAVSICGTSGVC